MRGHTLPRRELIATLHTKLNHVVYSKPRSVAWKVPRSLAPGALRYCVSTDGSGNRSIPGCEGLRVR